jgi:hypothetical protein
LKDASAKFCFNCKNSTELLFLTEKEIIRFDYVTALDPSCHYEFLTDEKFDRRATMYFNKTQTHFVVTNDDQVLFVDISDNDNPKQYDIGAKELVEDI